MYQRPDKRLLDDLVKQAQSGDKKAFAQIYDLCVDHIYRYSLVHLKDQSDAKDITSETFLRCWSYLGRYKQKNFMAFLYTIARNLIIDHHKKQNNQDQIDTPIEDTEPSHEDQLIQHQSKEKLIAAIQKLPDNYKDVIVMKFINDEPTKNIAKAIGKSEVAVRVIQHRALQQLKKLLKNEK